MGEKVKLESFLEHLLVLSKMYDMVRIVDPLRKTAKLINEKGISNVEETCYELWKKNKICKNCIAIRSYYENKSFFKVEYNGSTIFMITTVPISTQEGEYVIEFIKDVTDLFTIQGIDVNNTTEIYKKVNRLNEIFVIDELTGVYNRRFIKERLEVEILKAISNNQFLCIILSDLDNFKNINDTYGHIAGDNVLIKFAEIIKRNIRDESDWVARYGGDEFLVCLTNANEIAAYNVGERIRREVAKTEFFYGPNKIVFTASFGIAMLSEKISNVNQLIESADEKLYEAKKKGGNYVAI